MLRNNYYYYGISFFFIFYIPAEHDQLFHLVYERVEVKEDSMEPHFWSYRQQISLENLGLSLRDKKSGNSILFEFLRVVSVVE